MSFTGERFIPGEGGCQIAYEHLHRYFFALRWAQDGEVLDLACGNGYGAALLARCARHVWALDIDGETITAASDNWRDSRLTFLRGDATQLPFQDSSMDLVVAMETLEHIENQGQLLREIARVCSSTGTVLISTPNKAQYTDARDYINPFHKRELYLEEFADLLKRHFACVEIAGQQIRAGSLISCDPSGAASEIFEDGACNPEDASTEPMYYVAVCSQFKLQRQVPPHSVYLDSTNGLLREEKHEINRLNEEIRRLGRWTKELEVVVKERDKSLRDLQNVTEAELELRDQSIRNLQNISAQEMEQRDLAIRNLQLELHTEVNDRDKRIIDLLNLLHAKEKEFDDRGKWALSLQAEVERLSEIRRAWLYRILSHIGLLPK